MTATVTDVAAFARTLDQELVALLRGASLECLVCGEFVMHARAASSSAPSAAARPATKTRSRQGYNPSRRPGDRGAFASADGVEESPDTVGQDAGARPGGESRRKVEQRGDRRRRQSLRRRRR